MLDVAVGDQLDSSADDPSPAVISSLASLGPGLRQSLPERRNLHFMLRHPGSECRDPDAKVRLAAEVDVNHLNPMTFAHSVMRRVIRLPLVSAVTRQEYRSWTGIGSKNDPPSAEC